MDRELINALADKARSMDPGSVMKKTVLRPYIRNRIEALPDPKETANIHAYNRNTISRRDFLKTLGLAGTGIIAGTLGYGILPEQSALTITGKASGSNFETIPVSADDHYVDHVSSGDTISNKLYDITASDTSTVSIQTHGSNWTIQNIGVTGKAKSTVLKVGGQNGTIKNVYLGDGSLNAAQTTMYSPPQGPIGAWISHGSSDGPIDVIGVNISQFANSGIYGAPTSTTNGEIMNVQDSYFDSNNISAFKIGTTKGTCTVKNTTIRTDHTAPATHDGQVDKRTIWALQGKTIVQDSDIQGPIRVKPDASVVLKNTKWDNQGSGTILGSSVGTPTKQPPKCAPMTAVAAASGQACSTTPIGGSPSNATTANTGSGTNPSNSNPC